MARTVAAILAEIRSVERGHEQGHISKQATQQTVTALREEIGRLTGQSSLALEQAATNVDQVDQAAGKKR